MNGTARCALYEHHKFSSIPAAIGEDILRFATYSPEYRPEIHFKTKLSIFFKTPILCLLLYRVSHFLYLRGWSKPGRAAAVLNLLLFKAAIPCQTCIGPGCFLGHCPGTCFHGTAGRNLTLYSLAICCPWEDSFGHSGSKGPQLGDDVTLGGHAVLLGPIVVGDKTKIAPLTRLTVDCPENTLVISARVRPTLLRLMDVQTTAAEQE